MDIILLIIFSYALYKFAESYNITPWKWVIRYISAYVVSSMVMMFIALSIYGINSIKDMATAEKYAIALEPFILLYQFILFFFFRNRIVRYVHLLDQIDKQDNDTKLPDPPAKEQKDFSYFR